MWRRLRIAVLQLVLASVAFSAWHAKANATAWKGTLRVAVYPLAADDSAATRRYLQRLGEDSFQPISDYLNSEAARHGVTTLRPVDITLGGEIRQLPPPRPQGGSVLDSILWSLQLRYWAWKQSPPTSPKPQVRLYLLYHDPALNPRVPHSSGLEKGMLGVVHLFADPRQTAQNHVVAAHELLHTLGASDKYDMATGLPLHPDGYAAPFQEPRYPQSEAELMAGRLPLGPDRARIPDSLDETLVGPASAREIGWRR